LSFTMTEARPGDFTASPAMVTPMPRRAALVVYISVYIRTSPVHSPARARVVGVGAAKARRAVEHARPRRVLHARGYIVGWCRSARCWAWRRIDRSSWGLGSVPCVSARQGCAVRSEEGAANQRWLGRGVSSERTAVTNEGPRVTVHSVARTTGLAIGHGGPSLHSDSIDRSQQE
jgi:hypothetical protein